LNYTNEGKIPHKRPKKSLSTKKRRQGLEEETKKRLRKSRKRTGAAERVMTQQTVPESNAFGLEIETNSQTKTNTKKKEEKKRKREKKRMMKRESGFVVP